MSAASQEDATLQPARSIAIYRSMASRALFGALAVALIVAVLMAVHG